MHDLDKALADISDIRSQIAAGTAFRGYGPTALAATGGLALVTCTAQSVWLDDPGAQPLTFLAGWVATALVAAAIVWAEMKGRSRRHHSGLADAMIYNAVVQFLPAAAAGLLLTLALVQFAADSIWLLPGLWQVLVGIGIFASARSLPRGVGLAGAWYFASGLSVLALASESHALSPWAMGVPFATGQMLLAVVMYLASGEGDGEA
jgi:hypothetical protein